MPRRSTPSSSAFIPMVVLMQVPRAVATRSVGENASPLPLLSAGASVASFACDGPCVASQWRSPVYLIEILTMADYPARTTASQHLCHPERSEGPHKSSLITPATLYDPSFDCGTPPHSYSH